MKYEKAGVVSKDNISAATLVRFKEVERKGGKIICPVCSKAIENQQTRSIAFIGNGPNKDAYVEMIHSQCANKLPDVTRRGI